ncbi:MAG TPA: RsmE family RNA methyltransferase [Candidatus Pacearchaeota archaeon]|nr:RsmE family RNA methyltransferase [Candidatus Pacearchaeota archaeon]
MKVHRFFWEFDPRAGKIEIPAGEIYNQIKNVLRLKISEKAEFFNEQGQSVMAKLSEYRSGSIIFDIVSAPKKMAEEKEIILYCAILKKDNFELVVQKATELGVSKIVPLVTRHTVKLDLNRERLKKIIIEAAELSGRIQIPELSEKMDFSAALQRSRALDVRFFCNQGGKKITPHALQNKRTVGIFIGPEGGWQEEEIAAAHKEGCYFVSLGKYVLRGETAAIVALALIINN